MVARLRLQARKRRPRYARPASLPGPQEHPAHGTLHRAGTDPFQGMVERLKPGHQQTLTPFVSSAARETGLFHSPDKNVVRCCLFVRMKCWFWCRLTFISEP